MKNKLTLQQKQTLSLSLKLWLPILQSSLEDLEGIFVDYAYSNPFFRCHKNSKDTTRFDPTDLLIDDEVSLYDTIKEQLTKPLFPTPQSQQVANEILLDIDNRGFFDGDLIQIANTCGVSEKFAQKIHQRFAYIDPAGIGARDIKEACAFQLTRLDIDDELYNLTEKMIEDLEHIDRFTNFSRYKEALNIIKNFRFMPSLDFLPDEKSIIPDFFVDISDSITIRINDKNYPDIEVVPSSEYLDTDIKQKLKEARDLVGLLEFRKTTLHKLATVIVEKQLNFFIGGELKPLVMKTVAQELGFEESTISRAVSNKYLECSRGIYPLKYFFTNKVSSNLSSSEIKNFMKQIIKDERRNMPLSDDEILEQIENRFNLKMVRRTVTKYRKLLDLPSSKERKKLYAMDSSWTI